jgi:pyruvate formate lyase activating enzyme
MTINTLKRAGRKKDAHGDPALDALIWKMDRFAIHDGPGIRTNIYFKGCPLRCPWCSNPEGQRRERELGFSKSRCAGCGLCSDSCSQRAIELRDEAFSVNHSKCSLCGKCCMVCPTGALEIYGSYLSLSNVMDVVERDRHVYRQSGGGITCTGGEPLLQLTFLERLLAECRRVGIHTALETCGYLARTEFRKVLNKVDWLFFDLKHVDGTHHKRLTGKDNTVILDNLRTASSVLGDTGKVLVVRQVVVPGINDGNNIRALAELVRGLSYVPMIELLPYHAFGMHKYQTIQRAYLLEDAVPPPEVKLREYRETIESFGVKCKIGGL